MSNSNTIVVSSETTNVVQFNSLEEIGGTVVGFSPSDSLSFNSSLFGSFSNSSFTSVVVTESTSSTDIEGQGLLIVEQQINSLQELQALLVNLEVDSPVFIEYTNSAGNTVVAFAQSSSEVEVVSQFTSEVQLTETNFNFTQVTTAAAETEITATAGLVDTILFESLVEETTISDFEVETDILQFKTGVFGNFKNSNFTQVTVNESTSTVESNVGLVKLTQEFSSLTEVETRLEELDVNGVFATYTNAQNQTVLTFFQEGSLEVVTTFNAEIELNASNFSFAGILAGSASDDFLSSGVASDILNGFAGDDTIQGLGGNDTLRGGDGNDILNGNLGDDRLNGGDGNDTLNGGFGNNFILGGAGDDLLIGRTGFDIMLGGDGDDTLRSGIGRDRLNGGAGDDELTGGAGIDRFIFATNQTFSQADIGTDTITDFVVDQDIILLDKTTFAALTSVQGEGFSVETEFALVTSDEEAESSDAFIVYNSENGKLFYNADGSTAHFATLTNNAAITAEDFFLR
ncbi:MAG: calcium-binding protein [Okeania sp. SIO2B3]|nr:calcium-binding protein [Okeania sp. SIO2B3]